MAKPKKKSGINLARIDELVADYQGQRWALIPLLQKIQEEFGYIPPEATQPIARAFTLFPV